MSLDLLWIVGILTASVSVLVKVLGLPDQIMKNHKRKSTEGLSVWFFVLGFLSYALWTLYGAMRRDWVVVVGQGAGMVTMGIIAYQIWLYKGQRHEG